MSASAGDKGALQTLAHPAVHCFAISGADDALFASLDEKRNGVRSPERLGLAGSAAFF